MDEQVRQSFIKLMDYQKKDIELRKLNNLLERDDALASMNKFKHAFNEAKQTIADCEQQADSVLGAYAELVKYIDDNEVLLAELEGAEAVDEADLESRVKKLESLKSKFQSADKKMHDIAEKSKSITTRKTEAIKTGNAARQKFGDAKEKHGKLVDSKSAELETLKADLAKRERELDPELFEKYKQLVEDGKFPPVVPASGDEKKGLFNCGGCGLNLPQKGNAMLKDSGWCRCENCRRLIVHLN